MITDKNVIDKLLSLFNDLSKIIDENKNDTNTTLRRLLSLKIFKNIL